MNPISTSELLSLLSLRDLSDPAGGHHAMQDLLSEVCASLARVVPVQQRVVRNTPLVTVSDNYDRLNYPPDGPARAARYTRYVSPGVMLRSHTSAEVPRLLESYRGYGDVDVLLVVPGLVYRRDSVDRTHVGEPHQVDLWRLRRGGPLTVEDLEVMTDAVVRAVLPDARSRSTAATHPYTTDGRQVDVLHDSDWLELCEAGLAAPEVLAASGLSGEWSACALGMGLDRALMLKKGIPDIRMLRSVDSRVDSQMHDLTPWRGVSSSPPTRRDLSVMTTTTSAEELGDQVRHALAGRPELLSALEEVRVLSVTAGDALPASARVRMGAVTGQSNVLLRLVLRPVTGTLSGTDADRVASLVYRSLHQGTRYDR